MYLTKRRISEPQLPHYTDTRITNHRYLWLGLGRRWKGRETIQVLDLPIQWVGLLVKHRYFSLLQLELLVAALISLETVDRIICLQVIMQLELHRLGMDKVRRI